MVYIVTKSGDAQCALSRAGWEQQVDVYKLAKRGVGSCRRLWQEFAAESPSAARLVADYAAGEKAKDQAAIRHLDVVLSKAEKPGKRKRKLLTKSEKKQVKRASFSPEAIERARFLRSLAISENPADRELF